MRIAVEVRGCFWHSCPQHGNQPLVHESYWVGKLARNAERDRELATMLEDAGWKLLVVWEHEDPERAADVIAELVRPDVSASTRRAAPL
jgi:DNA mismatch endonuclease (patch repair protein)